MYITQGWYEIIEHSEQQVLVHNVIVAHHRQSVLTEVDSVVKHVKAHHEGVGISRVFVSN